MLGLAKTISDLYGKISSALTSSSKYTDDAVKVSVETCNKYTDEQITKVKQQSSGTLHGSIALLKDTPVVIQHSIGHTNYSIVVQTSSWISVSKGTDSVSISCIGDNLQGGFSDYIISY